MAKVALPWHAPERRSRCLAALAAALLALCVVPAANAATISAVGTTTAETGNGAGTITIAKPPGTVFGDHLRVGIQAQGGSVIPAPPGWSVTYSTIAPYGYSIGFDKTASASEPSSYTFDLNGVRKATATLDAWHGVDPVSPIDTWTNAGDFSGASLAPAPSVTTTSPNDVVFVRVTWTANVTSTLPPGVTQLARFAASGTSPALTTHSGYYVQGTPGSTPVKTFTSSSSTTWGTLTVALRPDVTPPVAPSILTAPATPANTRAPSWSFSGEAGATFQCRVARGATIVSDWAACANPYTADLTGQPDGTYTFSVRAIDPAGNTGAASTSDYTLDATAPAAPTITAAPPSPGRGRAPSWSFSGEANATFECRLDRGATTISAWSACTSPSGFDLTGQPDGTYTLSVRATDLAGNTGATATSDYTLDTTAPVAPTIDSAPASPRSGRAPTWSFSAEAGASFQCRLDRGATTVSDWAACTSPYTADLSLQPDGAYTLSVRAIDLAGNTGPATTSDYTLDTIAPAAPTIDSSPGASGSGVTPSWSFSDEPGASFECRLDRGATTVSDWAECTSPHPVDLSLQPDGAYTLSVRAIDAAGNTGAAVTSGYTLITTRPAPPVFDSPPSSPANVKTPSLSFSGDAGSTFECRVTRAGATVVGWAACTSPHVYDLSTQPDSAYTLGVRAINSVGTAGAETTLAYALDTAPPGAPTIDSDPGSLGNGRAPSWSFSGEAGASFECRLDRGGTSVAGWAPCTRPVTYDLTGRPDGTYTFSVRASDQAGNTGATRTGDYLLDTTAPGAPQIDSSPGAVGTNVTPVWSLSSEPGATLECRLDRGATTVSGWTACTSPRSYDLTGQPDGTYTLSVRATDPAGNTGATRTDSYLLLTTPPGAPLIDSSSAPPIDKSQTPSWTFSTAADTTYECQLERDGVPVSDWTTCTSPASYDLAGQPDGAYTFSLRARNLAGTIGSVVSADYLLDTTAPVAPSLVSSPGPLGRDAKPSWSFTGEAGALFQCRLTRRSATIADWSPCTSPSGYDLSDASDGTYTFAVRSIDAAGNLGPMLADDYALDTAPPAPPTIDASPDPDGTDRTPSWSFSGEAGAVFECRLVRDDTRPDDWAPCTSPKQYDLSDAPADGYTFSAHAIDRAGNTGPARTSAYRLAAVSGGGAGSDGQPAPSAPGPSASDAGTSGPATPASPAGRTRRSATPSSSPRARAAKIRSLLAHAATDGRRVIAPSPAKRQGHHHGARAAAAAAAAAVTRAIHRAAVVVAKNADKSVFPGALIFIVLGFMGIQGRIDGKDPKLALAPVFADNDLEFLPPPPPDPTPQT